LVRDRTVCAIAELPRHGHLAIQPHLGSGDARRFGL